jgi:sugar fermentation stimulation protein A
MKVDPIPSPERPDAVTPWLAYPQGLRTARVTGRPNRFVLEATLADGAPTRVHLADPGRLTELGQSGWDVLVQGPYPKPLLPWRAVAARVGDEWVSLRPTDANLLARRLIEAGLLPELSGGTLRSEVSFGHERFDLVWTSEGGDRRSVIEVKSASLVLDGVALFPDAVSARASRHLLRLASLAGEGWEPRVIFVCQRAAARVFRPAESIDPVFAATLRAVLDQGVQARAFRFRVTPAGVDDPREILVGFSECPR